MRDRQGELSMIRVRPRSLAGPPRGTVVVLAAALAAALPALAQTADEVSRTYRIETAGTTQAVGVGRPGTLVLSIVPTAEVHVDPRAPLKIALEATPGLDLSKTSLGKADPVDPKAEGRRFEVPFVATAAGKHEARAKLEFYVCSDRWCVKQSRDVTVAIEAR
jgi:hypothetical protein